MIEDLLRALRAARQFRPQGYVRFAFESNTIGWIRRDLAPRLRAWADVFEFTPTSVRLRPAEEAALSTALAEVARVLASEGAIHGWRGETYAIRANPGAAVLFHLERAAMRFFGLTASAAHLNGYIGEGAQLRITIARRAGSKAIDPGLLDNLVAGGVPSAEDPWQTLQRECGEEAGIAPTLAQRARAAGVLRVCREVPAGLHSEIVYIHDLLLPADFAPRNTDGEVSEFLTLDPASLLERIAGAQMTVEAGLVCAEFALRHHLIQDSAGEIGALLDACRD